MRCCPPTRMRDNAGGASRTCMGNCLHTTLHAAKWRVGDDLAAQSSSESVVAAQNATDPSLRLLAYRWYPTSVKNWDGRLVVASGVDADEHTGYGFRGF